MTWGGGGGRTRPSEINPRLRFSEFCGGHSRPPQLQCPPILYVWYVRHLQIAEIFLSWSSSKLFEVFGCPETAEAMPRQYYNPHNHPRWSPTDPHEGSSNSPGPQIGTRACFRPTKKRKEYAVPSWRRSRWISGAWTTSYAVESLEVSPVAL